MARFDVSAALTFYGGLHIDPAVLFAVSDEKGAPVVRLKESEVTIATAVPGWSPLPLAGQLGEDHPGVYHASPPPPPPLSSWKDAGATVLAIEVIRGPDRGFAYVCLCSIRPDGGQGEAPIG
jgi:hypothetical protein